MGRPYTCRCDCSPFDFVTLKAFDSDGAFLYEYKIVDMWETHDGLMYASEIREASGLPWTRFSETTLNFGFGTNSTAQPTKTGTAPTGQIKTWALDAVVIDRVTGGKTVLFSDIEHIIATYTPGTGSNFNKHGLPSLTSATPTPQRYAATEAGYTLGNPLRHSGRNSQFFSIYWYDDWVQSVTSRFRMNACWMKEYSAGTGIWTFRNGGSNASFDWDATAAAIETALESISGVVSATVTGGPLPMFHVDVEIEWTTSTGRFTQIDLINSTGLPSGEVGIYDFDAGGFAGRTGPTVPAAFVFTSDDTGTVTGNAARYNLTSDAYGILFGSSAAWSGTKMTTGAVTCAGVSTTVAVSRVKHGKVLITGNRQAGSGNKTFAVVNESTGTVEGVGDTFLDGASPTHMFIDSTTVGAWGLTDCGRMSGGDQFVTLPTTGGAAGDGLMTGENTMQGCDADHIVTHGSMLATRDDPLSATTLDRTTYSPHTVTAISGGDAFFPTKDYNQHIVKFYAENILYNTDLEWRLNLGDPGSAPTFQTAWFAYGETTANVMSALDAFFGDNSASLPVIQENFATPADNADTPIPWYARGPELLITASATPSDIFTHGLMPNNFRFQIEIKNGTRRLQRGLCKIAYADSTLVWQRDIGQPATDFTAHTPTVTYDHEVAVHLRWEPLAPDTHPTLVSGPLP